MTDPGHEADRRRFGFGPAQRPELIGGLAHSQIGFLLVGVATAVAAIRVSPDQFGLAAALTTTAVSTAAAFGTIGGRPVRDWLPALHHHAHVILRGRRRWANPAPRRGHTLSPAQREEVVMVVGAGGPPPVAGVEVFDAGGLGVIADRRARTFTAVAAVQGESFMLLDPAEQYRRLGSWAQIPAGLARAGNPVTSMQWLQRSVTEDPAPMRRHQQTQPAGNVPPAAADSYLSLLADSSTVARGHRTYLALHLDAKAAGRAIRDNGGGDQGAAAVLAVAMGELAAQCGPAELTMDQPLPATEVTVLLRGLFDPATAIALNNGGIKIGTDTARRLLDPWPLTSQTGWGHYRADASVHISFWISAWPPAGAGPDFLAPLLLGPGVTRTVSVIIQPIGALEARREIQRAQTSRLADEELRHRAGYRPSAARRRQGDALTRREEELADGHAECRYSGYLTISATTQTGAETAATATEQAADQAGLELRRMWGETDSGFAACLPLPAGLKP